MQQNISFSEEIKIKQIGRVTIGFKKCPFVNNQAVLSFIYTYSFQRCIHLGRAHEVRHSRPKCQPHISNALILQSSQLKSVHKSLQLPIFYSVIYIYNKITHLLLYLIFFIGTTRCIPNTVGPREKIYHIRQVSERKVVHNKSICMIFVLFSAIFGHTWYCISGPCVAVSAV